MLCNLFGYFEKMLWLFICRCLSNDKNDYARISLLLVCLSTLYEFIDTGYHTFIILLFFKLKMTKRWNLHFLKYISWLKYQTAKNFILVISVGRFLTQTNFCRIWNLAIQHNFLTPRVFYAFFRCSHKSLQQYIDNIKSNRVL